MRAVALVMVIAAGCAQPEPAVAPPVSAPVAVETASPVAVASPSTTIPSSPHGALPFAAQMVASDGVLAAALRLDVASPGTARTEIFIAELGRPTPWRSIAVIDAFPTGISVASGRVAVGLRRQSVQGGGAFSAEIVVIDAASGARGSIWSAGFSAATFRGGGGGPKRVSEKFVLGPRQIAYVRLSEGAGGDLTGELRIRDLVSGRDTAALPPGSSPRWIEPVAFANSGLVYSVGGDPLDEVHLLDDFAGVPAVLARAPFIRAHAVSGRWLLYTTTQNEQAGPYRVVLRDIVSGAERVLDTTGDRLSLNATHAVWRSSAGGSSTFRAVDLPVGLMDLTAARNVRPRPSLFDMTAVPGGVLAHDMSGGFSTIAMLPLP